MINGRLLSSKRALLIGNNNYEQTKLWCCKNDAEDVGLELKKMNFKVTIGFDLTFIEMTDLIKDFITEIIENDFIIFFYSGHGAEWQNQTYLIPIDNQCLVQRPDRYEQHAITIQQILNSMQIKKPFTIVVLLDCCRAPIENRTILSTKSNSLNVMISNGSIGNYIVFACGPDQVTFGYSLDYRHSLFTYHLLKHINESNLKIDDMMCRVCEGVYKDSHEQIYIHRSSSLRTSEVYFKTTTTTNNKTLSIDNDYIFSLIIKGLIFILELENQQDQKEIIDHLLKNGRQSLIEYKDKIAVHVYNNLENENLLMKFLKIYFEQQWKLEYSHSYQWFSLFLRQYQTNDHQHHYEYILTRTAEYGNRYMKNCSILSIVLQFLFEGIDDQCLKETNIFDQLWTTITNEGLISIRKYSEYIIEEVMTELIDKKQTILFQSLREYYRIDLFHLFIESQISNKQNLYEVTLDNVAEFGWRNGLKAIEKKLLPKDFKILLENFEKTKIGK